MRVFRGQKFRRRVDSKHSNTGSTFVDRACRDMAITSSSDVYNAHDDMNSR